MFNLRAARSGPGQGSRGRVAKGSHKLEAGGGKPAAEVMSGGVGRAGPLSWTPHVVLPFLTLASLQCQGFACLPAGCAVLMWQ